MKSFLKRWKYEWRYSAGKPVWDTGTSPPELLEYLSQHPPGRALDLGCGSGTNLVTMAKAGWQVCGVDFSRFAIARARRKIRQQGLRAELWVDDVTKLYRLKPGFDLILDIGCFHQLNWDERQKYLDNVRRLLKEGGDLLLYAHCRSFPESSHGIDDQDVERFLTFLRLIRRTDGWERQKFPSVWLWLHKERSP